MQAASEARDAAARNRADERLSELRGAAAKVEAAVDWQPKSVRSSTPGQDEEEAVDSTNDVVATDQQRIANNIAAASPLYKPSESNGNGKADDNDDELLHGVVELGPFVANEAAAPLQEERSSGSVFSGSGHVDAAEFINALRRSFGDADQEPATGAHASVVAGPAESPPSGGGAGEQDEHGPEALEGGLPKRRSVDRRWTLASATDPADLAEAEAEALAAEGVEPAEAEVAVSSPGGATIVTAAALSGPASNKAAPQEPAAASGSPASQAPSSDSSSRIAPGALETQKAAQLEALLALRGTSEDACLACLEMETGRTDCHLLGSALNHRTSTSSASSHPGSSLSDLATSGHGILMPRHSNDSMTSRLSGASGGGGRGDGCALQHSCTAHCLGRALVEAFVLTDLELAKEGGTDLQGTTAVAAMVGRRHVWVANCGTRRGGNCFTNVPPISPWLCIERNNLSLKCSL